MILSLRALRESFNTATKYLPAAIVILVCAGLLGCSSADSKASTARAATQQVTPVSVATALRQDVPVYLTGLGSVTAYNTVSVRSRIDGQLTEIHFKEGEHVKKGDLLAVIDPRPYEVQLSQAQAALYRDQAQLRDASLNYERYKGLFESSGAMSQQQVDSQKAAMDQLEGTVRSDQAAIDNVKLQIVYCRITAPIGGRIGLRLVDQGNMVHAADTNPMLVITQLEPIAVLFTLPEDNLPAVAKRMASGALPVEAYSRDDQTKLGTGKLQTIDNQIDQTTGTGKLKAVFDNTDDVLWPNQFVNVRLLLDTRKDNIVVPAAAVQRGPQGTYVFVVKSDNKVDLRPVTVALTQNNLSAIATGLAADEVVVTDGQDKLQSGSTVQVPGAAGNQGGQHNGAGNHQGGHTGPGKPASSGTPSQ